MKHWNPRYLAYCREHRRTPKEQLEHDRKEYPGGHMCGFTLWINTQWDHFRKLNGAPSHDALLLRLGRNGQKLFDKWLQRRVMT